MANQDTVSLRKHLAALLHMKGAHVRFEETVADFPAGLRAPGPGRSTWRGNCWSTCASRRKTFWISAAIRNDRKINFRTPIGHPPKRRRTQTREKSIRQFQDDLKAMQDLIADTRHDLLAKLPHGTGQTLLREALLIADHNAYHLGQLVFLRKMLEAA